VRIVDDARVRRYMERYGFDRGRAEELAAAMSRPTGALRDHADEVGQAREERQAAGNGG
jgi:hypothetical protein